MGFDEWVVCRLSHGGVGGNRILSKLASYSLTTSHQGIVRHIGLLIDYSDQKALSTEPTVVIHKIDKMMYKDASETRKSKSMESPLTPPKTPPETRPNAPPYDREREVKPLLPSPCISEKTPLGWNQPRFEGASLELVTSPTRLSRLQGRTLAQKRGQGGLEKIKTFFEYNIDSTIGEDDLAPWDQRQSDQSDQSSSDDSSDSSGQKDKSDEETRIEYEDGIGWEGEMIYHRKTNRPRDRCFRSESPLFSVQKC